MVKKERSPSLKVFHTCLHVKFAKKIITNLSTISPQQKAGIPKPLYQMTCCKLQNTIILGQSNGKVTKVQDLGISNPKEQKITRRLSSNGGRTGPGCAMWICTTYMPCCSTPHIHRLPFSFYFYTHHISIYTMAYNGRFFWSWASVTL